jgi:L-rhamnose mutarotase
MQRVCFILQVRPNRLAEYKDRHQHVWPEMRQALSDTGWSNYSLFLREDGLLVGYVETPDFEAARAAMQKLEINARWQSEMAGFFMNPPGITADKAMVPLEEVFHLE